MISFINYSDDNSRFNDKREEEILKGKSDDGLIKASLKSVKEFGFSLALNSI